MALVIPYLRNPNDVIPMKINTPFSHPLGVAGGGMPNVKLLALVIPYSGNPKGRFDTGKGNIPPKIVGIGHSILRELQ